MLDVSKIIKSVFINYDKSDIYKNMYEIDINLKYVIGKSTEYMLRMICLITTSMRILNNFCYAISITQSQGVILVAYSRAQKMYYMFKYLYTFCLIWRTLFLDCNYSNFLFLNISNLKIFNKKIIIIIWAFFLQIEGATTYSLVKYEILNKILNILF